ncbi:MHS family MFS transporter [Pseudonocardia sp. MCCB 268]|nr:MHS family MFS transporter [Pseudonocardia cytotoxica]
MRLIQGFSLGGEYGGAVLMAVEHFPAPTAGAVRIAGQRRGTGSPGATTSPT